MTLDIGYSSLSEARLARGLTLEDAERSTRISRKFLIALEEHDYTVFPAPVYARGFLRTYCRYLGIDPEIHLANLPAGWTENALQVAVQPSPQVIQPREPRQLPSLNLTWLPPLNLAWIVAGAVLIGIIGLGIYVSRGEDNLGALEAQLNNQQSEQPAGVTGTNANGERTPAASPTQRSAPRALVVGLPGTLPNFQGVAIDDVEEYLTDEDITYLRIDATSSSSAAGIVLSQSPVAGSDIEDVEQVTVTVSMGPTRSGTTRTDCSVLEASNQRTSVEQAYFEANCADAAPEVLPDRTSCADIRGTDYRSPEERTFFLTYCITS